MESSKSLPKSYKAVHLAKRPKADIVVGETFETKTHSTAEASSLKDGQVLFQAYYLSLDPAMRGWLNDTRSYLPPVKIGAVMRAEGVGVIRASKNEKWKVGDVAKAMCGWSELAVLNGNEVEKLDGIDLSNGAKLTDALGALGMVGITAWAGIIKVGQVKAGDFVVVSGAAGAVGSLVGQIAKIKGATVLGLAGTDEKVRWLKEELGFDDALNYKDKDFVKKFRAATKSLIDVYFDNVGGEILDLCLSRAKEHSRFVMCGGISQYNTSTPQGPKNYLMIVSMRIRMEGYIVFDFKDQFAEARRDMSQWLAEGKIKRKETILKGGVENAVAGLRDLYKGINTGKLLVEVTAPEVQLKAKL